MKVSDSKPRRITVRLSEDDYKRLAIVAGMGGMTVSAYVRMMVSSAVAAVRVQESRGTIKLADYDVLCLEDSSHEDE